MIKLVQELRSTNSLYEKIDAVLRHKDDKYVQDALKLTYDPFFQTHLKKVSLKPKVERRIKVKGQKTEISNKSFEEIFPEFATLLQTIGNRGLTGNAAKLAMEDVINQADEATQEILLCILKKNFTKCKISDKIINSAIPGLIATFDVQLANKYIDFMRKRNFRDVDFFYASPKLDGYRGYFRSALLSRKGKPTYGFGHIEEELYAFTRKYSVGFVDGELYSHEIPFHTIQSIAGRKVDINEEDKKKIFFNIFAAGEAKANAGWKSTKDMYDFLTSIEEKYEYLRILPVVRVNNNLEDIKVLTQQYVDAGYEGSMLRHPINAYNWIRSDALLKYKFFIEHDFTIVGFYEGEGEFVGTLGGILFEGEYEGKRIKCECGSGFKILPAWPDNRNYFWTHQKKLLGKTVEIKFQGVQDEPNKDGSGTYALRFPTYSKLKLDR
jgi:DNA ligase 1